MGTLYERITELCKAKGVSGSRMCLDLGLSKSTMSDLKYGRTKGMTAETAQKIANYFGVTVGFLLGEENKKEQPTKNDGLSEYQQKLIELAQTLSEQDAQLALQILRRFVEQDS